MRLAIACFALIAVAASSRGGCGKDPYEPCAGKSCGAACTQCAPDDAGCFETAVLKACAPDGSCTEDGTFSCAPTDPCAGKACGDSCNACGAVPCATLVMTACDPRGQCVPATPWLCHDPCAGKRCGDACQQCPPDATGCFEIMCVKSCDGAGRCVCSGSGTCP